MNPLRKSSIHFKKCHTAVHFILILHLMEGIGVCDELLIQPHGFFVVEFVFIDICKKLITERLYLVHIILFVSVVYDIR